MADNVHRFAGTAYVKVDGRQLSVKADCTVMPGRVARQGIAGQDRVHGYAETPRVPSVELEASAVREFSYEEAEGWTNVTIIAEDATGRAFVLRNAWCNSELSAKTSSGSVRLKFEGLECKEMKP